MTQTSKPQRVHLIAIGGAGMSAVAKLYLGQGYEVSGTDRSASAITAELESLGAQVTIGHSAQAVSGADTVVVSSAIRADNIELVAAQSQGIRVLHRSEALAELMAGYRGIAVAGAHGKTTTSGMIAVGLEQTGAAPSWAIGSSVPGLGAPSLIGAQSGSGHPFVIEADESDGSFLAYPAEIAVVTNVEADHLDHYGSEAEFFAAFGQFLLQLPAGGTAVICLHDDGARLLADQIGPELARRGVSLLTYGQLGDGADYEVEILSVSADNFLEQPIQIYDTAAGLSWPGVVGVPGSHNALNLTAAWAVLRALDTEPQDALDGLGKFHGTGRRYELRGKVGGVSVIDDYAHHPTEVAALLDAARTAASGRVIAVFQPHLYSRTQNFAERFARALELADFAAVTDIYGAREEPLPGVSNRTIADRFVDSTRHMAISDPQEAARWAVSMAAPGDTIFTVGAGDITQLGARLLDLLSERDSA